ncbi:hypothetical protein KDL45_14500, partial [bacterium]|nr:hypothetical protein [bacterium]
MKGRRAAFLVISALVIALAAFWRFHHLTLKPFHHDEGVNWYFLDKWFTEGVYAYDPTNFHGPLLYEIAYLPARFIGQGEAVLRAMPALMGLAAIAFLLGMRRWIGAGGALIVGALLAIAPVDVYFSRTFIHEAYLVASL